MMMISDHDHEEDKAKPMIQTLMTNILTDAED